MIKARMVYMTDDTKRNEELWGHIVNQIADYWESSGAEIHQREASLSVPDLISGWANKTLLFCMAHDEENRPVGIGIGIIYRHLFYSSSQLVLEVIHAKTDETLKAILDQFRTLEEVTGIDKIYVPIAKADPDLMNRLHEQGVTFQSEFDFNNKCVRL